MAATVVAIPVPAQSFSSAFEALDRQAQIVTNHLDCQARAFLAGQQGMQLPTPSRKMNVVCALVGGRMVAAFVETDSTWKRATRFSGLDPWTARLIGAPLDTVEVVTLLRAQRYSEWLAWTGGDTIPGIPVVFRADSSIHVWLIPETYLTSPSPSVGGERHYVYPPDAKKERYVAPVPSVRRIPEKVDGEWRITTTDTLPTFSELLLANMLVRDGQRVAIEMTNRVARLLGDPRNYVWVFIGTKKP